MSGKILLDTNAVIAVFADDEAMLNIVANAEECCVSTIVLGELCYGAHHSSKVKHNLAKIVELRDTTTVLVCDATTAEEYGRIKSQLRDKGRPIPENDIWIGAIAAQHQLPLVSRDEHFDEIEGLDRLLW